LVPIEDESPTAVFASPLEDESPTTVMPIVPRGTVGLSTEQSELLERLRSRAGEAPGGPPRASGRRPRRGRRVFVRAAVAAVAFSVVLVLTAVGIAGALYEKYNHQLKRVAVLQTHDKNIIDPKRQLNAENFLVIGSDSRAGLGGHFGEVSGARSD